MLDLTSPDKLSFPSSRRLQQPLEPTHLNTPGSVNGESLHQARTHSNNNSRSRTPSLRSMANRRQQQPYAARAMTPTRSIFRPQILQRSSSHGGPGAASSALWLGASGASGVAAASGLGVGGTGSGYLPRSAKKWARTAHLHQVRSAVPSSVRLDTNGTASQRVAESSTARSPIRRAREEGTVLRSSPAYIPGFGLEEDDGDDQNQPLVPFSLAQPPKSRKRRKSPKTVFVEKDRVVQEGTTDALLFLSEGTPDPTEGDGWIDTDESEAGFGVASDTGDDAGI